MASHPKPSAKNDPDEFARFSSFMKRLVTVPHSEIKEKLDAEKRSRKSKRGASSRASREKG